MKAKTNYDKGYQNAYGWAAWHGPKFVREELLVKPVQLIAYESADWHYADMSSAGARAYQRGFCDYLQQNFEEAQVL